MNSCDWAAQKPAVRLYSMCTGSYHSSFNGKENDGHTRLDRERMSWFRRATMKAYVMSKHRENAQAMKESTICVRDLRRSMFH